MPQAGQKGRANGHCDRVGRIVAAWIDEIPSLDPATLEIAIHAIRLDSILHNALDDAIRALGLTRSDFDLLTALHTTGTAGDIRHSELQAHLVLSSGGTTNILNRLERRGLIERTHKIDDARSKHVRLTAAGEQLAVQAMFAYARVHAALFRDTGGAKAQKAAGALRDVMRTLGE